MMQYFVERRHRVSDDGGGAAVHVGRTPEGHAESAPNSTIEELAVDPAQLTCRTFTPGGLLYFDAPSGAGGDMIVAALLDLGVPWSVVSGALSALALPGATLRLARGSSGALSGLRFGVEVDASEQTERSYADICRLLGSAPLSSSVRQMAQAVFDRLARAEARVHQVPLEEVHFHEVGAVDSIVDIVVACAAIEHLGCFVWCSPLPLGRGFVSCRHGVIPLPAPATVECLVGLQCFDSGLQAELVTPTAAAVFGALCRGSSGWPSGVVEAIGWGRGTRTLPDRPNLLRAVLVRPAETTATPADE